MPQPSYKNYAILDLPIANVYPRAPGPSLGVRSTSLTPFSLEDNNVPGTANATDSTGGKAATSAGAAPSGGMLGQPLAWWMVLIVLLIGTMFVARKLGDEAEFANIKLSVYNILIISLAAVVGIGFLKVLLNRFQVPGLTTFINAV